MNVLVPEAVVKQLLVWMMLPPLLSAPCSTLDRSMLCCSIITHAHNYKISAGSHAAMHARALQAGRAGCR